MNISTAILHTPWRPERAACLAEMLRALHPPLLRVFGDTRPEGVTWHEWKTHLFRRQWEWALGTTASHHLFLTDDLHTAPNFFDILRAMSEAIGNDKIIGLLSNHPGGVALADAGYTWYRCNSWVVGPAYLIPRRHLVPFYAWWSALPDTEDEGGRRWHNDDSAVNYWNTLAGGPGESWHPLPTIIEHRTDIESTVGHGDRFSRERVSWRESRKTKGDPSRPGHLWWTSTPRDPPMWEHAGDPEFWIPDMGAPMLVVGEGS